MNTSVSGQRVRLRFIVAHDQLELWHRLKQDFSGDEEVEVILDRRRGERRQRRETHEPEQRRADRRRLLPPDQDLRFRSFVIIHH